MVVETDINWNEVYQLSYGYCEALPNFFMKTLVSCLTYLEGQGFTEILEDICMEFEISIGLHKMEIVLMMI